MNFTEKINLEITSAMKARNESELRALRSIKAALLLAATSDGSSEAISDEQAIKIVQKLAKQRKESFDIFTQQNRPDLASKEQEELLVFERYLPTQMGDDEIKLQLKEMLTMNNLISAADFGKAMPLAMKHMAGKADGKKISELLKQILT
ncbi:MAG: GatB/YqeY domain-containing protein [Bacteroidetes bacterium]|nr:GatB/YqeY domain-containing protein [Bacteroidota bacterium]